VWSEHGFTDNILLDVPLHPAGLAVPLVPLGVLGQSILVRVVGSERWGSREEKA